MLDSFLHRCRFDFVALHHRLIVLSDIYWIRIPAQEFGGEEEIEGREFRIAPHPSRL